MLLKALRFNLVTIMAEKDVTQELLAEASGLSLRYVGDIIRGKKSPTIYTLERLCTALEVTPNDLLLNEMVRNNMNVMPWARSKVLAVNKDDGCIAVCSACKRTIENEYELYCERCGSFLVWSEYFAGQK